MSPPTSGPVRGDLLVLRCIRLGDSSKIVSALSSEYGKVRLVAKGARSLRSKLASLLEPGNEIEGVFYPREGRELWTLSDAALRRAALTGARSLDKLSHLFAALELGDRLLPDFEGSVELEGDFRHFLERWHAGDDEHMSALFFALELRLLESSGWGLDPRHCGECGRTLDEVRRVHWSVTDGRLECDQCASGRGRWLEASVREALQDIDEESRTAGRAGRGVVLSAEQRRGVGRLLHEHMGFHLPRYRLPTALHWLREGDRAPEDEKRFHGCT